MNVHFLMWFVCLKACTCVRVNVHTVCATSTCVPWSYGAGAVHGCCSDPLSGDKVVEMMGVKELRLRAPLEEGKLLKDVAEAA